MRRKKNNVENESIILNDYPTKMTILHIQMSTYITYYVDVGLKLFPETFFYVVFYYTPVPWSSRLLNEK